MVVEDDEISTQIIRHLNAQKGGRVTFIPLNRVKAPHVVYPRSSDVIALLNKLKFLPKYNPAFAQVRCETWIYLNYADLIRSDVLHSFFFEWGHGSVSCNYYFNWFYSLTFSCSLAFMSSICYLNIFTIFLGLLVALGSNIWYIFYKKGIYLHLAVIYQWMV